MSVNGYTRQSAATIVSGNTIQASDFNNEYNQLQSAFDATVGHNHDGTAGGGQSISLTSGVTGILPVANGGTNNAYFTVAGPTVARTYTFPDANSTIVTTTAIQTLTNKALTSPVITTPSLGVATATSINKVAITAPATSATLTIVDGKTLTSSNTLTLAGTDGTTITFQATGTYVSRTSTDTLTNKTFDTAGSGNVFKINGTTVSAITGTGSAVLATTPTLITPVLGVATATSINKVAITAPATSATLTIADGKVLTASNTLVLAGTDSTTITFQGTDTYVGRATTDTLTNKTFDTAGSGNVLQINSNAVSAVTGSGNTAVLSAGPTFTGVPAAPTASAGTNTTQLATTAFVTTAVANSLGFKVGSFTYNLATATGSQSVTGVGFTPRAILFLAVVNGTTQISWGVDDGTTKGVVPFVSTGAYGQSAASSIYISVTGATDIAVANVSSFDADGFTLAWTKTGSPTGSATIKYLAMR